MPTRKFLLIEDEEIVVTALSSALENRGVEIDVAETGERGLELFAAGSYDLVISDKNLPGIDGIEVLRRIRDKNSDLPFVMVTAYASVDSAMQTLHLGIDALIEKPFDDIFEVAGRIMDVVEHTRRVTTSRATGHFSKATKMLKAVDTGASPPQGLTVLVANPNGAEAEWLVTRLKRTGGTVSVVTTSRDAVTQIERDRPNLVIADDALTSPDVFELAATLQDKFAAVLCVVTVLRPPLESIIRLIDLKVRAVVEKPFKDAAFDEKIAPILESLRSRVDDTQEIF